MGVNTVVPVEEALSVDNVADLECLNCLVNCSILAAEVGLYCKGICVCSVAYVEVKVVSVLTRSVPLVEERNVVAVCILACYYCQALEGYELVHMLDKLCLVRKYCCYVGCGCNVCICSLNECKRSVEDLNLAGVLTLVACNSDLCSGNELCSILLGASHIVCEVCAVLILEVCNYLVVPPRLSSLYVCLDYDLSVHICCNVLIVCHCRIGINLLTAFGLGIICRICLCRICLCRICLCRIRLCRICPCRIGLCRICLRGICLCGVCSCRLCFLGIVFLCRVTSSQSKNHSEYKKQC